MEAIFQKLYAQEPVRIAFFGDSVTQGCFEGDPMPEDVPYVYSSRFCRMLQNQYPGAEIELINAGVGGDSSGMGLFRIQKDVIEKNPDLCIVCFGINDSTCCAMNRVLIHSKMAKDVLAQVKDKMDPAAFALMAQSKVKDAYRYSMDAILSILEDHQIPAIVLTPNRMSLWPITKPSDPLFILSIINTIITKNGTMDSMIAIAREVAAEHCVPIADGDKHWKELESKGRITRSSYVNGTNHPSRELHQELADVLYQTFENLKEI